MKNLSFAASILKNTNKIITHSEADCTGVRENTFVKFKDDSTFYTVAESESLFYIKDFETISRNKLKINDDVVTVLLPNDVLTISYKEYELLTLNSIINKGVGYKIGDKLFANGGIPSINILDNISAPLSLIVTQIGPNGEIETIQIDRRGKYTECPQKNCDIVGGSGKGAILDLDFKTLENRVITEKDIAFVEFNGSYSIVTLAYSLPVGVKDGKISINKWELLLNTNYANDTKINQTCEVLRDVTPNLALPLLIRNSFSIDSIFNQAMIMLDNRIKDLENNILLLKENKN